MLNPTIKKTLEGERVIFEVTFEERDKTIQTKQFYNTDNILSDLEEEINNLNLVLISGQNNVISNSKFGGHSHTAIWIFQKQKREKAPSRTRRKRTPSRKSSSTAKKKDLTNNNIRGRMANIAKEIRKKNETGTGGAKED